MACFSEIRFNEFYSLQALLLSPSSSTENIFVNSCNIVCNGTVIPKQNGRQPLLAAHYARALRFQNNRQP